jgi:4-carboxymuconolactone decarboxylase
VTRANGPDSDRRGSEPQGSIGSARTPRFPAVPPEALTTEQQEYLRVHDDSWRAGLRDPSGRLGGPFDALLRVPGFASALMPLADHVRSDEALPPRARELVVLMVAIDRACAGEWRRHYVRARALGWSAEDLEQVRRGETPSALSESESGVYDLAQELLRTGHVSNATLRSAQATLGSVLAVEVVALIGYYVLIDLLTNVDEGPADFTAIR